MRPSFALRVLAWLPLLSFAALIAVVTIFSPSGVSGGEYTLGSLEAAEHGRFTWPAIAVLIVDVCWLVSIVAFTANLARRKMRNKVGWFLAMVFVPPIALPLYLRAS